jgi:hypothetical protein
VIGNRLGIPWTRQHKRILRISELALLLTAILGPWGYSRINVPAQYTCNAPFIRLEGDFCGTPLSGGFIFLLFITEFSNIGFRLASGEANLRTLALGYSSLLLIVLPILSAFHLILRGENQRRVLFHIVVLGLAAGAVLFVRRSVTQEPLWPLWGIWVYGSVAAGALIVETIFFAIRKRPRANSSTHQPTWFPEWRALNMENRGILSKILASAGTLLVWFPLLAPVLISLGSLIRDRIFRFDYLIPAELFQFALLGGVLLLWAALRARSQRGLIGGSLGMAVGLLVVSQVVAMVTGLASGESEPSGVWYGLVLGMLIGYSLALVALGIGGGLLLRDLFKGAPAPTMNQ